MDNNATKSQQVYALLSKRSVIKSTTSTAKCGMKYHYGGIIGLKSKDINVNAVSVKGYKQK